MSIKRRRSDTASTRLRPSSDPLRLTSSKEACHPIQSPVFPEIILHSSRMGSGQAPAALSGLGEPGVSQGGSPCSVGRASQGEPGEPAGAPPALLVVARPPIPTPNTISRNRKIENRKKKEKKKKETEMRKRDEKGSIALLGLGALNASCPAALGRRVYALSLDLILALIYVRSGAARCIWQRR